MKGSIQKRSGARGTTWYGKYDYLDPVTEKRVHRRVSAPTRKECESKLRAAIAAAESGRTLTSDKQTVREFVEQWLASIEHSVRPSTHRRYSDAMRSHVIPALGSVQLSKLSPPHLKDLYATRLKQGLSPTTVNHLHVTLHGALKQALRWNMIERNPCDLVDPPLRITPETITWSVDQTRKVLTMGDAGELAALWRLALICGMRRGELLGLKWDDIDLDRGTLSVRRTLSRGSGGTWHLTEPKTASGRRQIALPESCVAALRMHRLRQLERRMALGPAWEDHGFVFTGRTGAPLHVNSMTVHFKKLITDAQVPAIRFHDLRHTCATLLLAEGVHPKIVQERLGHSDISMTLNRYSHITPSMQRQAADTLDAALLLPTQSA
jgi:integrase